VLGPPIPEARRFPSGCVASPHHLASTAGLAVLAGGGNAVDAAVATNLTLAVVTPYLCGFGGDLFALIWKDGLHAYNGSGRAPAAATPDAVRAAAGSDHMPLRGPLTVTVPGAVDGWFELLERFGSRSFQELSRRALAYAEAGFAPGALGAGTIARSKAELGAFETWSSVYGEAAGGRRLVQADLARTIRALANGGPEVYYRGPIAEAIAGEVRRLGGPMAPEDLSEHRGQWFEPLSTTYRDTQVVELAPNTKCGQNSKFGYSGEIRA
jgi:gamma-glutamyltranspeptidase/glutathione hydrolase